MVVRLLPPAAWFRARDVCSTAEMAVKAPSRALLILWLTGEEVEVEIQEWISLPMAALELKRSYSQTLRFVLIGTLESRRSGRSWEVRRASVLSFQRLERERAGQAVGSV